VQQEVGIGCARVRAPRLELTGSELAEAREAVRFAQTHRPRIAVPSTQFAS